MANSNNRFTRQYRLNDSALIRRVYASGSKHRLGPFTIFVFKNNLENPRICISVAKRYVANATVRNAIKRIVREGFRLSKVTLQYFDIIITINCKIDKQQLPLLKEQLNTIWARLQK